jgi:type VI secretion system protein ImpA
MHRDAPCLPRRSDADYAKALRATRVLRPGIEANGNTRMATFDFPALGAPLSEAEPCGPDLDLGGDADYMNFVARTEGVLPTTFFSGPEGKPFDRSSIDFDAEFATIAPLLARTRDLRLLVILAKLLVLKRDLAGFVDCIALIDALLKQNWDDVHPQAFDGDFGIRTAALETLDDMPPVVFPLQYLPLINHRRLGPLSYRAWMIATGEAKPREGEEILDPVAIQSALTDEELPVLIERRAQFHALQSALTSIREICVDRLGAERAAKLERLPALAVKIAALFEGVIAKRDPAQASAKSEGAPDDPQQAGSTVPAGAVASTRDVADALAAIAGYFARFEPSSPALLLVRQAEQLMGKSFLDVMRILMPNQVEQAAIQIGKDQVFDLPIERLASFAEVAADPVSEDVAPEPEPVAEPTDAPSEQSEIAEGDVVDGASTAVAAPARRIEARTRADAIRLLEQIGSYYRIAEPSSPVPFLTDRARSYAERDFLSLLKELLPQDAFKGPAS